MNPTTENPAPSADPSNLPPPPDLEQFSSKSDNGGMTSFEAATAFSDAFDKLKIGEKLTFSEPKAEEAKAPVIEEPKVEKQPEPKAEEKPEVTKEPEAKVEQKLPSADDLASLGVAKEPEAKESDSEEIDPALKGSTKKAQQAWAEQRKALQAEAQRRKELEAKVAELEKAKVDPAEIERIKAANAEYERELQVARVEATQEYKEAVLAPLGKVQESVTNLASKYEISAKSLFESLADPDGDAITDLAAGMNDRDRFRLYELAEQFTKVRTIRDRVINNAQLALEKINASREEQTKVQMEEQSKAYSQAIEKTWEKISEQAPVFKRVEGNDAWNAQLDDAEKFAKTVDLFNPDPAIRAGIAWRAALSPMLLNQVTNLYGQLKEAQAQLSKYTSAKPKAGGGSSPADIGGGGKPQYDDFLDALKGEMRL